MGNDQEGHEFDDGVTGANSVSAWHSFCLFDFQSRRRKVGPVVLFCTP
jgi:hypothetical protein